MSEAKDNIIHPDYNFVTADDLIFVQESNARLRLRGIFLKYPSNEPVYIYRCTYTLIQHTFLLQLTHRLQGSSAE